jgi:hypothetical protein
MHGGQERETYGYGKREWNGRKEAAINEEINSAKEHEPE